MAWLKYLMFFGALQGALLTIALLSIRSPRNKVINRLFAFLVMTIVVYLLGNGLNDYFEAYPKLFMLTYLFCFCYAPLFHLFLEALLNENFKLGKAHLIHALPSTIYLIVLSRYLLMPNAQINELLFSENYVDLSLADLIGLLINFYFVYKSWQLLSEIKKGIWHTRQLLILKVFCGIIAVSNLLWVMLMLPRVGISLPFPFIGFTTVWTSMAFMIFFFTYMVIIRSEFFSFSQAPSRTYKNVNLDQQVFDQIESKVLAVMKENRPFVDPEFSLNDLAELVGTDKFKLSIAINKGMGTTFFNLINTYRVEEFIRLMESNQFENFSLLGVAYESGFKSKSTFYKSFKDLKGKSPKEYFKREVALT